MAKRTRGDGGTPATVALAAAGIAFTARRYAHDPAAASYGLEAAEALGVEPARVRRARADRPLIGSWWMAPELRAVQSTNRADMEDVFVKRHAESASRFRGFEG